MSSLNNKIKYFATSIGCLVLVFACTSAKIESLQKPNILFIVSEDNGPDLGCYGVKEVTTPNLDQLAEEGVLFENAYVPYSVCSPSRGAIYTGLYPHQNGQIGLATHKFRMYKDFKTLPVYMKEAGYRTGCLGKIHVNPESAIPFDYRAIKGANFAKKNLKQYAEEAETFISSSDDPFFLMVNFPDAHYPLQRQVEGMPANPIDGSDLNGSIPFIGADSDRLRKYTANYYNSMNRLDESVGMLLEKLEASGKSANTLIIYIGDHGAQFSRGKCSNYEAGLKIPLIIKQPGSANKGFRTDQLVSTIDLLPTFLNAAQIEVPEELPGKSLMPFLDDKNVVNNRDYIFADGNGSSALFYYPRRSVRGKRFKLIHNLLYERENPKYHFYESHKNPHFDGGTEEAEILNASDEVIKAYKTWRNPPKYELYDLQSDPYEFKNLSEDSKYKDTLDHLIATLENWQKETNDPLADPVKFARFNREIDSVNSLYPNHTYAKHQDFEWEYPNYFYTE
jgi:N-sulfoglucosamine sulfohydrolase